MLKGVLAVFEELNRPFVFFRTSPRLERAEVPPPAALPIDLA